jgi:hypothetical protein
MTRHQNASFTAFSLFCAFAGLSAIIATATPSAQALELDWSGQFRAEYHYLHNYTLDSSDAGSNFDTARAAAGGYYVPSGGSSDATFETLFLRVRPKIVVNDNIYIKSEWWLGDPVYGLFGNGVPYTTDQRQFYSNQSRGSTISAQRYWAEFLTDFGTIQVGRAPLNWGLGVVWNSGDGLWDRYESTGDTIRLVAKFGAFSVIPSFISYSTGNAVGGSCNFGGAGTGCVPGIGSGAVNEYSIALKYDNVDEDFEGGVNFIKRLAGAGQDNYLGTQPSATSPNLTPSNQLPIGMNYNIWDIYAKKRIGKLTLGGEAPITTGNLGTGGAQGLDYSTFALAAEAGWKASDTWEFMLKGGHAPGQPNFANGVPDNFRAFFFNPAYHLGNIMFNYQPANFHGPNTQNNPGSSAQGLVSAFDNPIVNANYLQVGSVIHTDKWAFNGGVVYAQADKTAASGQRFYNYWTRTVAPTAATADQSSSLGTEFDLGAAFQWDEYLTFRLDTGVWLPGAFYKFSNVAGVENATSPVFNVAARVGVTF